MKHLKIYEKFEEANKIIKFCREYDIKEYKINEDGSIDVTGSVNLNAGLLDKIPIKFNRVNGSFECINNNLTTLENSPRDVLHFYCYHNKLTTLIGGPLTVRGDDYNCCYNNLKDVYGFLEGFNGTALFNDNPVYEILILSVLNKRVKFIHLLNDNHVIRNGDTIIQDRLEDALFHIGIEKLDKTEFKNYKLV